MTQIDDSSQNLDLSIFENSRPVNARFKATATGLNKGWQFVTSHIHDIYTSRFFFLCKTLWVELSVYRCSAKFTHHNHSWQVESVCHLCDRSEWTEESAVRTAHLQPMDRITDMTHIHTCSQAQYCIPCDNRNHGNSAYTVLPVI